MVGEAVAALAWGTRNKQKKLDVSMWTRNPGAERQRHGDPSVSLASCVRPGVAQFVTSRADVTGKLFNPRRSGSKVRKTGHSKGHNAPFKVTSYTHNDLSVSHYVHPHLRFDHSSVSPVG